MTLGPSNTCVNDVKWRINKQSNEASKQSNKYQKKGI